MDDKVVFRTGRITQAGPAAYLVLDSGGREPYGLAVVFLSGLAVQEHVTADLQRAQQWCRRLAQGRVRPCHLRDVLTQWLCE